MNNRELWNNFLENIKNEITNVSFDTWFNEEDTKFYSLKDDILTITVNQEFIKRHIEENYIDIMQDAMSKVTNANITFNIVLESDVKALEEEERKLQRESSGKALGRQSAENANLNPNYTFINVYFCVKFM